MILRSFAFVGGRFKMVGILKPRLHQQPLLFQAFSSLPDQENNTKHQQFTLYQYAICPFCNIVKSVLHYGKIPYQAMEVNPLTKAQLQFSPEYRKVPILTTSSSSSSQQQWNGTDEIVQHLLETEPSLEKVVFQRQGDDSNNSTHYWMEFAKNELAPLLYPNLCNSLGKSFQAFAYVHQSPTSFTSFEKYSIQYIGSVAMYMAASKIKQKRNITNEKEALMEALKPLEETLQEQNSDPSLGQFFFLSQNHQEPDLGDLYLYGVLRGLQGLPVHDMVMTNFPYIQTWYHAVQKCVEQQTR